MHKNKIWSEQEVTYVLYSQMYKKNYVDFRIIFSQPFFWLYLSYNRRAAA